MGSFVLHGNIIDSESPERLRVAADSYLVCEEGRCTGVFSDVLNHAKEPMCHVRLLSG